MPSRKTAFDFSSRVDFDFKWSPGGNSGLGIYYPGTGDAGYTGMEIQILDSADPKYTDFKDYQFNRSLNGRAVIENAQLPGVSARGSIGLQSHGSAIDFANLWIKEF